MKNLLQTRRFRIPRTAWARIEECGPVLRGLCLPAPIQTRPSRGSAACAAYATPTSSARVQLAKALARQPHLSRRLHLSLPQSPVRDWDGPVARQQPLRRSSLESQRLHLCLLCRQRQPQRRDFLGLHNPNLAVVSPGALSLEEEFLSLALILVHALAQFRRRRQRHLRAPRARLLWCTIRYRSAWKRKNRPRSRRSARLPWC
jgi:hypothetical protein